MIHFLWMNLTIWGRSLEPFQLQTGCTMLVWLTDRSAVSAMLLKKTSNTWRNSVRVLVMFWVNNGVLFLTNLTGIAMELLKSLFTWSRLWNMTLRSRIFTLTFKRRMLRCGLTVPWLGDDTCFLEQWVSRSLITLVVQFVLRESGTCGLQLSKLSWQRFCMQYDLLWTTLQVLLRWCQIANPLSTLPAISSNWVLCLWIFLTIKCGKRFLTRCGSMSSLGWFFVGFEPTR